MHICSRHWQASPPNLPIGDIPRTSKAFLISGAFRAFRHPTVIKISHNINIPYI